MNSIAILSIAVLCFLNITPSESAFWTVSNRTDHKVFLIPPKTVTHNWWNAYKFCRQHGYELAGIESRAENDALVPLLLEQAGLYYWTSGSDAGRTVNSFVWLSNGRSVTPYTNWYHSSQPSNTDGKEGFLHYGQVPGSYAWNDITEEWSATPICEIDFTSPRLVDGSHPHYFVENAYEANWFEAVRSCRQRGMRLASIESESDLTAFKAAVAAHGITAATTFWTSGTDNGQSVNSFFWFSSGNALSFTAWAAGEPNNNGGVTGVENCLMVTASGTAASFNDVTCTVKAPFVCEVRA